jgi:hypothetical protein
VIARNKRNRALAESILFFPSFTSDLGPLIVTSNLLVLAASLIADTGRCHRNETGLVH